MSSKLLIALSREDIGYIRLFPMARACLGLRTYSPPRSIEECHTLAIGPIIENPELGMVSRRGIKASVTDSGEGLKAEGIVH